MKNTTADSTRSTLREIPKGEYFRLKDSESAKTYRKCGYDHSARKYCVIDTMDAGGSGRMLKPSTSVFIDFTY